MFPISIEGKFEVDDLDGETGERILNRAVRQLEEAKASEISHDADTVIFRTYLFRFVLNWNILVGINRGEIEILRGNPGMVTYKFSTVQLLVIATILSIWLGFEAYSRSPQSGDYWFGVFAWLVLFLFNYGIAAVRLHAFVREAITRTD